jgi:Zn-dependent M28 family amino/carboxypeptidase
MIAGELAALGWSGPPGDGEMCQAFELEKVADQNVVAHLSRPGGGDPAEGPFVIVGAHYDAQGVDGAGNVYPGADDNASGVAALLEIARLLRQDLGRAGSDVVLIAFGAEERGVLGARAYVKAPTAPLDRVALMINLDMVGRPFFDGSPLRAALGNVDTTIGFATSKLGEEETDRRIRQAARGAGARVMGVPEQVVTVTGSSSDSVIFSEHVPTLFLSTSMHKDYHRPTDTAEKIDYGQLERVVRLVLGVIREPFSSSSSRRLRSTPPAYPTREPSAPTTR